MEMYLLPVMLVSFVTDVLLLLAASKLCGVKVRMDRIVLGAMLGAVFGGACLVYALRILNGLLPRLFILAVIGATSFGVKKNALRCSGWFAMLNVGVGVLSMVLGGLSSRYLVLPAAIFVAVLLYKMKSSQKYIPLELSYMGKTERVLALKDTGNVLRDPLTGEQVLIVDCKTAHKLVGLRYEQLIDPIGTVAAKVLPGLRLIPYRAVGVKGGMLLAMRLNDVRMGDRRVHAVVAFAPDGLDGNGKFQALAGGCI